jgi:UDP-3-O-[3-hydroxymyristoyl] glucosamine N-acyltransferase
MAIALGELAVRFGSELRGDPDLTVDHIASLGTAGPGALSFLANAKLASQLPATRATAVVLDARSAAACPAAVLITPNPHALFARIAELLHPLPPLHPGVHPSAVVAEGAQIEPSAEIGALSVVAADAHIGARCLVGPGCIIGSGVRIGADSRLVARVNLERGVRIGQRVLIHPGAVIGADGFGLAREGERWLKVPQIGAVVIEDDVEIGANTTIDRGAIDDTMIAEGVKLDNQIQVGHNVYIGPHTAIAACTGISGSVRIGARCVIAGAVGIAGHLQICDDVVITAMAAVSGSIKEPGVYSSLIPIEPARRWRRVVARLKLMADREARRGGRSPREKLPRDGDQQQQRSGGDE